MYLFNASDNAVAKCYSIQYTLYLYNDISYEFIIMPRLFDGDDQGFNGVLTSSFGRTIFYDTNDNHISFDIYCDRDATLNMLEKAIEDIQNANAGE